MMLECDIVIVLGRDSRPVVLDFDGIKALVFEPDICKSEY